MAPAIDLQQLLLAASYRMALEGAVAHEDIPDDPTSESERRQPFFFRAAGLPAFYVHKRTRNELLRRILRHCEEHAIELAALRLLAGFDQRLLPCAAGVSGRSSRRRSSRILRPTCCWATCAGGWPTSACARPRRLVAEILNSCGERDAMRTNAAEFNRAAEKHYRDDLRQAQLREALHHLREDVELRLRSALTRNCEP